MTRKAVGTPLSAARRRVLRTVTELANSGPVTHQEVSAAVGGHPNTARQHLDALLAAGLVDAQPLARPGPGRRPFGFTPTPRGRKLAAEAPTPSEPSELVGAFAAYLVRQDDPAGAAREVGDLWGRREAAALSGAEPIDALIEVLDMLGFTPARTESPEGSVVVLRTCSLLDSAHVDDATVMCDLHRGMIEGVVT
ncbi:MAG TPA: helix-turn-helix domain-containing protein, partial [Propionibacteriaceae bacterium]|nr:helix-turn-helix domain-containing protein [Propionibacteriaceae bacterium]